MQGSASAGSDSKHLDEFFGALAVRIGSRGTAGKDSQLVQLLCMMEPCSSNTMGSSTAFAEPWGMLYCPPREWGTA